MKTKLLVVAALAVLFSFSSRAQGITSGTISGSVLDENGEPLIGATIRYNITQRPLSTAS